MNAQLQTAGQDAPPTGSGKMPRLQGRASPRGAFRFTRIPIQSGRDRGCSAPINREASTYRVGRERDTANSGARYPAYRVGTEN